MGGVLNFVNAEIQPPTHSSFNILIICKIDTPSKHVYIKKII